MSDATPTHAPTSPVLFSLNFHGTLIRGTRHTVHGRMLMANDVVKAIGYAPKAPNGTRPILAGLRVSDGNRVLLQREDFDTSDGRASPPRQGHLPHPCRP